MAGSNYGNHAQQIQRKDKGSVTLTLVEPLVMEISADVTWTGNAFRDSFRYLRVRPDLEPGSVQVPAGYPLEKHDLTRFSPFSAGSRPRGR